MRRPLAGFEPLAPWPRAVVMINVRRCGSSESTGPVLYSASCAKRARAHVFFASGRCQRDNEAARLRSCSVPDDSARGLLGNCAGGRPAIRSPSICTCSRQPYRWRQYRLIEGSAFATFHFTLDAFSLSCTTASRSLQKHFTMRYVSNQ